eukprot:gene8636-biopygen4644
MCVGGFRQARNTASRASEARERAVGCMSGSCELIHIPQAISCGPYPRHVCWMWITHTSHSCSPRPVLWLRLRGRPTFPVLAVVGAPAAPGAGRSQAHKQREGAGADARARPPGAGAAPRQPARAPFCRWRACVWIRGVGGRTHGCAGGGVWRVPHCSVPKCT